MLVDLPMPPPLTQGVLAPDITYYNGQGETMADLADRGLQAALDRAGSRASRSRRSPAMGVAGVVFIVDASYQALAGCYAPFEWQNEGVPALYVDRDTGRRAADARGGTPAGAADADRHAARRSRRRPSTLSCPAQSDETIIFNTHTDGTGFVEENGGVAFVQLARYFGSLPRSKRLRRTLVFAAWPGHFSNDLPQAGGWIYAHQDIVKRAAAALTVEHLGCTEWNDSTDIGLSPHRAGPSCLRCGRLRARCST